MLGKIFELGSLLKQAHEFGGKVQEMNDKLRLLRVKGIAGGGMVDVEVNGLKEMVACHIEHTLIEQQDNELIEDLVVAATNDAIEQSRIKQAESMRSLTEGIDLGALTEVIKKN